MPVSRLTRRYDQVHSYKQLPEIAVQQIEHFFLHDKDLEPAKWVKPRGWSDADEAKSLIMECIERAKTAKERE